MEKETASLCYLLYKYSMKYLFLKHLIVIFFVFKSSRQRLVANARTVPDQAVQQFWQDLVQTLTIAAQLFNRRQISAQQGWLFFSEVHTYICIVNEKFVSKKHNLTIIEMNQKIY